MGQCLLAFLLFIAALRCEAQYNLVPNWSFELPEDSCSWQCCFNVGSRPLHWYSWLNSPEHMNACAGSGGGSDSLVSVPQNGWTYQYAWDGDAYVGVRVYDGGGDFREYVGTQLIEPLVINCTYRLRFRTNPAYGGNYWLQHAGTACDNIGLLFTTNSNAWSGTTAPPPFAFRNFAHLRTTEPISDTLGWTLVEGTFIADSAYGHLVLGNFYTDALTNAYPIGDFDPWTGITFYLFDGIEVIPLGDCHSVGLSEMTITEPMIHLIDNKVHIQWGQNEFQAWVTDGVGRIIGNGSALSGGMEIPLSQSKGMYVLRLTCKKGSCVKKFVVQ